MTKDKETIVLSLGGSLIYPEEGLNIKFLREFNQFIREQVLLGKKFFIVCGGGHICRNYQDIVKSVGVKIGDVDVDWLGIHSTRLNAHLLRTIFEDIAHPIIIDRYDRKYSNLVEPVIIASGWKPGWSTDYDAVLLARDYGASTILNLSNIEMVYNKDPAKHADARPIEKTHWEHFRSLIAEEWSPGLSVPFDPVASKLAQKLGLTVIILKGDDFSNLENLFSGKRFKGTVITPFRLDATFFDREYFEEEKGEMVPITYLQGRIYTFLSSFYRALCIRLFLRPKRVLDVGCGLGKMIYYLRFLGVEAFGVEISKYALEEAHPKIKKYLKYGDILKLPFKDESFDLVITFDVLEHVDTQSLRKAVLECNRVAKRFSLHKIFTHENWWMKQFHGPDLSHVAVYDQKWWKKFFKKLGFKRSERFYPYLPHFIETLFLLEKK